MGTWAIPKVVVLAVVAMAIMHIRKMQELGVPLL